LSFEKFGFHPEIMAGIHASNYVDPTPIQEQAIPPVLAGRDVMGLAQTGTGKTAAFALPILQRLRQGQRRRVRSLVLAPTRELAEQTHVAIRTLGEKTRVSSMSIYGGVNIKPQIGLLKKGVDVVVACPGRLLDHIAQGTIHFPGLEVLVLDEADQMFDMGFLPDIRRILQHLPRQRQTLLFAAAMPDEIRCLAREILVDPVTLQVGKTAPPRNSMPRHLPGSAALEDTASDEASAGDTSWLYSRLRSDKAPGQATRRAAVKSRIPSNVSAG
jgi:ATP-dependent RNA helicase RhlE